MSIREKVFFGGAVYRAISADTMIVLGHGRLQSIEPSSPGLLLQLPDAEVMRVGGPQLLIANRSVTHSFNLVANETFDVIATVGPLKGVVLYLSDNSSSPGGWSAVIRDFAALPLSSIPTIMYFMGGLGGQNTGHRFNHQSGAWSSIALIPTQHYNSGAVAVLFKALVWGNQGADPRAGASYEPQSDTWTTIALLPFNHAAAAAVELDDKAYSIGSPLSFSPSLHQKLLEYDPTTNLWSQMVTLPPLTYFNSGAVSLDSVEGYFIGGHDWNASGFHNPPNQSNYKYTQNTDAWAIRQSMPTPARENHATVGLSGKVYVMGGDSGIPGTVTNRNDEYNPTSDAWVTRQALTSPRSTPCGSAAGGEAYLAGGSVDGSTIPTSISSTVQSYSPISNAWTIQPSLPTPKDRWANQGLSISPV